MQRRNSSIGISRGQRRGNSSTSAGGHGSKIEKPVNPKDSNCQYLTCQNSGPYRHMVVDCPHTSKNIRKREEETYYTKEKVVLFIGYNQEEIQRLGNESRNRAILDEACTRTVCGNKSSQSSLDTLPVEQLQKVKEFPGQRLFKFGGGECLKSMKCVQLPCYLAGKEVLRNADVVNSDIPLLFSLKSVKTGKSQVGC